MIVSCVFLACFGDGPLRPHVARWSPSESRTKHFSFICVISGRLMPPIEQQTAGGHDPNGRVVAGTGANVGWRPHLENVEFAELTTEVCDGRPSDVEREGVTFGGGRFCPWTARVISIQED